MLAMLAAVMLAAAPGHDTVFTADGGRILGTVVEEGPQGVNVQLPDGTYRRLGRAEVVRVQYADGSVSGAKPTEAAAPPPPAAAPPAPQAQPGPTPQPAYPPAPPPYYGPSYPPPPPRYYPPPRYASPPPAPVTPGAPVAPVYLTLGIGALGQGGHAESGISMGDVFDPQVAFAFEAGLRLNLHLALALYGDFGVGDPGSRATSYCNQYGLACSATTSRVGLLLRHTFQPTAPTTPWVAVGTGFESGTVSSSSGGYTQDEFTYSGWEMLRLQAGVDFRSSPVFGFGLWAGASMGRYSRYEDPYTSVHLGSGERSMHTTFMGGVRLILFP